MINVIHIYARMRRWAALRIARAELRQIAALITELQHQIADDESLLAALRMQHQKKAAWLAWHSAPPDDRVQGLRVVASGQTGRQP